MTKGERGISRRPDVIAYAGARSIVHGERGKAPKESVKLGVPKEPAHQVSPLDWLGNFETWGREDRV